MKKKIYISLFASVIILAAASCKKETGEMVTMTFDAQLEGVGHKNAADTKGAADPKVYLYEGQKPYWEDGDAIRVNDGNGNVSNTTMVGRNYGRFEVSFSAGTDGPYYAVYPASMASSNLYNEQKVKLPRVQTYSVDATTGNQKINAPMFAYNPSKHVLQFHNLCGLMKITVTNDKAWDMILDSIQVEATTKKLNGVMTIGDVTSATPKLTAPTEAVDSFDVAARQYHTVSLAGINKYLRSSSLESHNAGNPDAHTSITLYVYLPTIASDATSGNKFYIRVFSRPAWKTGSESPTTYSADSEVHISYEMRQTASTNAYVERNKIIPISISLSSCKPTFTSLKPFTVSSSQSKVSISRGNAQYFIKTYDYSQAAVDAGSTSTGYWRFSPRQWDFLHVSSLYPASSPSHGDEYTPRIGNWIEHFTWDSGKQPVRHYDANITGSRLNTQFTTWTQDWGVNFTNVTSSSTWRSLTQSEMDYLLKSRETVNSSNKCNFAWVTLTDAVSPSGGNHGSALFGIVILPDGFIPNNGDDATTRVSILGMTDAFKFYKYPSTQQGQAPGNGDNAVRYRDDNTMNVAQFEYYEARGCVFIPCIGAIDALGGGNDMWTENNPEGTVWTSTHENLAGSTDAHTLMLSAEITNNNAGDCRTGTSDGNDAECYRKFNVRLVRPYSSGGGNYKYDPFQ